MLVILLLSTLLCSPLTHAAFNIEDFGAKPDVYSLEQALLNGKAFHLAVLAANASATDRTVIVQAGRNYTILPHPKPLSDLIGITIEFDGTFYAWHENEVDWPKDPNNGGCWSLIYFVNTQGLVFRGNGVIEGNGYMWWWTVILTAHDNRPNLFTISTSKDTLIEGIMVRNAAQYHMNFNDSLNMTVQNIVIHVELNDKALDDILPTFPLNTDGIDISGRDIYFRNLTIQCYDDAVAVKPTYIGGGKLLISIL
jgi:polygalacturonase